MSGKPLIAIIGGSGAKIENPQTAEVITPTGTHTVHYALEAIAGVHVLRILKHGPEREGEPRTVPHEISYSSLAKFSYERGIKLVIHDSAVGTIYPGKFPVGALVFVDQYINGTSSGRDTYNPTPNFAWQHPDMTIPFNEPARQILIDSARELGLQFVDHGIYIENQGPEFESAAEVRNARDNTGGHLLGMTGKSTAVAFSQVGIPTVLIAVPVNVAAGLPGGEGPSHANHTIPVMEKYARDAKKLFESAMPGLQELVESW